jgi:hypothetical protein
VAEKPAPPRPCRTAPPQANNDPVYMGLAQMLQRNNNASLTDCAILSIGEPAAHVRQRAGSDQSKVEGRQRNPSRFQLLQEALEDTVLLPAVFS